MSESQAVALPTPMGDFVILYVADVARSVAFYERVFGRAALEASPGFAMFALSDSRRLGLWHRDGVQPPTGAPGGAELAFPVPGDAAVLALHAHWQALGLPIAQAPQAMDFGFTFTARDPDGHPLRVFAPGG